MSTFMSQARARVLRPVSQLPRPRLTVVPRAAASDSRTAFVVLVVGVLGIGLVGLLLINTALQQGAYGVTDLRDRASALQVKQQNLEMQVAQLQRPQRVAEQALRLGMVRNDSPAFLSLNSGKVTGQAVPGVAGDSVNISGVGGPSDQRPVKQMALIGGTANSASTGVTRHPASHPSTTDPKRSTDTPPGSQDGVAPRDTKNHGSAHTQAHQ
ncbi:MAG: hypothetical protein ACRDQA_13120 [Nocardioidaceae bacterium]